MCTNERQEISIRFCKAVRRQNYSVDALTSHVVLGPARKVVVSMLSPEDDVVVEVLELRDGLTLKTLWDTRITRSFQASPLKAVQTCEVRLPRLPGIDLVPKVVKDLAVRGGAFDGGWSMRWRTFGLDGLSVRGRALGRLGIGNVNGCAGTERPRLPPGESRTSNRDSEALATLNLS